MDKQKLEEARLLAMSMTSHPLAFGTIEHTERAGELLGLLWQEVRMQEAAQARATDQVVQLRWHDVSAYGTPCSDRTVLVASGEEWHSAWWSADAGAWIDCASGGVVELQVTHWAEPVLPRDTAHDAGSIDWTLKTR